MKTVINDIDSGKILFQTEENIPFEFQKETVIIDGIRYKYEFSDLTIKNGIVTRHIAVAKPIDYY